MKVAIESYNPIWNDIFLEEKKQLETIIGKKDIKIEHIGSTSIYGMPAKPIIDILIGVPEMAYFPGIVSNFSEREGYIYFKIYEKNIHFRRFFVKLNSNLSIEYPKAIDFEYEGDIIPLSDRLCHIHVVPLDHDFWKVHIKFRDILINNSKIRDDYKNLKLDLASRVWDSSKDYYYAKYNFIQNILSNY